MTPNETAAILRQLIDWRRDKSNWPPSPVLVEKAIDAAIEMIDRLEAAEKTKNNWLRANAPGGWIDDLRMERNALHARIKEMERQEPVAWTTKLALEYGASTLGFRVSSVNIWGEKGVPLYALPGAQTQPAPSLADAYQGALAGAAIWKKRALEAEDLNRKFIAEINGPTHMGEPAPSVPDGWPTEEMTTAFARVFNVRDQYGTFPQAFRAALAAAPEAKP